VFNGPPLMRMRHGGIREVSVGSDNQRPDWALRTRKQSHEAVYRLDMPARHEPIQAARGGGSGLPACNSVQWAAASMVFLACVAIWNLYLTEN